MRDGDMLRNDLREGCNSREKVNIVRKVFKHILSGCNDDKLTENFERGGQCRRDTRSRTRGGQEKRVGLCLTTEIGSVVAKKQTKSRIHV